MADKVILTKEQAEAIERLIWFWKDKRKSERNLILIMEKLDVDYEWIGSNVKAANEIPNDDFISALHYGYEVEPEYKVGDWVVNANGTIGKITNINEFGKFEGFWENTEMLCEKDNFVRHATPSEIAEEKERRMEIKLDKILLDLSDEERVRLHQKLDCGEGVYGDE